MKRIYPAILHTTKVKSKSVVLILSLFIFLFGIAPGKSVAQSISVTNVTTTPVCAGSDVTITFDVTNGVGAANYFTSSTDYQIYLSDAGGTVFTAQGSTFNNSTQAYDITDGGTTTGLTQTFTIPVATAEGAGYEISIGSSGPTFDGSAGAGASAAFTIDAIPVTPGAITGTSTLCENTTGNAFSVTTVAGATGYTWAYSGTGATIAGNGTNNITIDFAAGATSGTLSVTADNGCGSSAAQTKAITVTPDNTITLTSAAGTDAQTLCINTAITNITYSTTGATGATFSGLPAGVTGSWAANVVTISGTPTASGTFNYTVTLTGGCGNITATGSITVTPDNTITLTSAAGTDAQTLCINTAITNITYSTTGATGATFSGLPAGVSGNWAANVVTISGTPTASGTFNYTVTLTGGCGNITATGSITVTPDNTITLTSAAGTDAQTLCINTAITNITYSTTGATGATFSGLPAGVTGNWAANVVTISGTPTASSTFNYTVTLTGGCGNITATSSITVTPDNTITLTSAAGTNAQTLCINTAITNITYSTTGATGATFSGLPAGVTGNWAANVVTISGTPTASGTFNYTVTLTGGCGNITATGSITVTPDNTITLTSAAGTNAQTLCINTAITNITYSTTGATGAAFSGLPVGVTGNWAANVVTISGTPTASGTFNYTVTLTGGCGNITATGSITVTPDNTITLIAAGTDAQTICINTAITNITYSTTGATGATFSGLPAGVTGNWAANVVTISGTPAASGAFSYTVTTTGGCTTPAVTAAGTMTVTANNTIARTSAAGTDAQTKCINTAITNITYSTTGATGATFSGLPAGVTGSWAANVVTISGTPTASGTFNYTVTTTGGCTTPAVTASGSITVTPNNTITLTSAAGTDAQTKCINTAITNITYSTTGATGATFSGLPAGVTGNWAANVVTISGTPAASGAFSYTVTTTGGCTTPAVTAAGTITVTANNTIARTSAAGTDAQTKCINTAITNITYSTTGATGATFSGLPAGVTGSWAANVVTISGTPAASGAFSYTVTTTGGCTTPAVTAAGTITVTANNTIARTSAAGTDAQTKCINTAITNITYSTTGATGATFSGLPAGVTGSWAANVVTISGTPAASGPFSYTVTTTGGCTTPAVTATGTITVTPNNTITLTSAVGTNAQTLCINTAITNITYSTTGATGATFSGLPAGVTGNWAANVVTISGTPAASGAFSYTVTTTGGCTTPAVTAAGTMNVTPNNTIARTSAAGTDAQTKCINTAITNITYSTTGATGATFSGLPAGVTGSWAANVVTISGTPAASGPFSYTVTTTGGCTTPAVTAAGTMTVTANNTIARTSAAGTDAQTKCINTAITNITYSTTGATGATFSGLPAGVTGSWAANVVTISGTPAASGTFNYTVTTTGGCTTPAVTAAGTINVTANNTIARTSAAGTDAQIICITSAITNITYSTTGATGATFSGLPAGVTGNWAANVVTISGTPTASGTFNYTVTTTGGCTTPAVTAAGSITVNTPPVTTGVTICQGGSGSLSSSAGCAASTPGTAGPNFAGIGADNNGTGAVAWAGTGNISANDNIYATATVSSGGTVNTSSHYLQATNFGFAIPANAIINGIQVSINRFSSINNGTNNIQDNVVSLIKAGAVTGNDNSLVGNWSTTNTTVVNYGTVSDLWGTTWTPAQINAANFGVALSVLINRTSGNTVTASVDYITITISYTIPGTLNWYTVSSGGVAIGNGSPFNPVGVAGSGLPNTNTPGTYTFYAECTSAAPGCRTATTFLINPLPTITGNLNICTSGTTTTQLTGSGTPAAVNPWLSSNTGVATVSNTGLVTKVSAGTTVITYTNNNGCQITATVTVTQPTITGTLNVCIGGTTQLTGSGTPAAVNPWVSGTPGVATISNSGLVSGVTAGTTVITYTNNNGCTVNSTVTVNAAPSISSQPANQSTCAGTAVTYSVTASGTSPTYQWQYSPDNGVTPFANVTNGTPGNITYTNATTATLTVTPAAAAVNGTYYYRCVVSVNSCASVNSNSATLTVYATPTASNAGPIDFIICTNTTNVTLAANTPVAGHGTGIWSIDPSSPSTLLSQFSSLANPTAIFTPAINSGVYKLWWTISNGVCNPSADFVLITINPPPVVSGISANQVTCAGTGKTFTVTATGIGLTYQWQYSPDNATWTNVANGTPANINYTNQTTATLTVTPGAAAGAGTYYYRCMVTGSGCAAVPSSSATLTVNINSTINLSSAAGTNAQTVCQNTAITNITYAVGGGGTGASITAGAFPAGVTGNFVAGVYTISGIPTATGTFNYTITTTGPCTQATASGTITVLAAPTGIFSATETSGTANNDNIICAGATVTFTAPNAGVGAAYTFYVNGIKVQGPNTTSTFSSSTLINGDQVTVNVANAANCGATFGPITITVNALPTPSLVADKTTICAGDLVTFTATGGTNYNFKVNGSSVQSGAPGTYASSTLANGNSVTVDVTNGNNCTATSAAIVITVNALPTGTLSASPSTTICAGDNLTFTATAGFSNYNFKIDGISVQSSSSNTYSSSALTNGQVVSVIATNGATGCSGTFNNLLINVNAVPAGTLTVTENSGTPNDNLICAGSPVTFSFSLGFSNYNFKVNGASKQNGGSGSYINSALVNGDVVTVEVTNSNGCKATFTAAAITIAPSPAGTLTVSPSATICAGDNVVFTATSDPTFTNYNFKINGTPVQNGSGNTYTTASIANGDVVTVDVTNNNSCVSTFGPVNMVVSPLPTGTLTPVENSGLASNDGIICAGDAIVFTAPAGFINYDFIKNGITIQSGSGNTYTTSALVTGDQFTVAVTNATGCVGLLNTITVTVNTLPAVAPVTGTMSVCLNNTTQLSDATGSGVWTSLDPGIAAIDASGLVTGVGAGIATINYTVTNANGCSTTVSATVTVNAPPTVAPVTGNTNVCPGTTSQLSDATAGGVWSSSDNSVATVDGTGLVTGVAVGTVNIIYTVTDVNGCTGADTATVTVSTLPSVSPITTTAPSFDVCEGGTIQLKDATPGGTWSSTNPANATINSSGLVTGILNGTTTINYTITTTCNFSVIASVTVTVHALPSATISYTGGPFCTTAGLVPVNQTGTTGGTYSAAPAGLSIAADGTINPSASSGGTFTVTYTIAASGGCGIFTTTTSVTITTAPSATISYAGSPFCTTAGPVTVTRTGTAGGTYSSTAGLTINAASGTITPATSAAGTYTVTYTVAASGGCAVFTTTTSVTITTAPSATISYAGSPFCTTSGTVTVTRTGTAGGTYSSAAGLTINAATGTITPATSTGGIYTVTYTIAASGGCAVYTTTASITITAAPTAVAGTPVSTCSNSGAVNITAGSGATNQSSILWTSSGTAGTIANATSLTTATYTPSAADIAAGSVVLTLTANGNGSCAAAISTKTVTINAFTPITSITATPSTICLGNSSNLSIPSAGISTLLSENFEGASSTFTVVNGIPFTNPARSQWIKETSVYTYFYNYVFGNPTSSQQFNSGSAHFMLTNSDDENAPGGVNNTNTSLVSPAISTVGYTALNFSYRTYYRRTASDVAVVEVSTNGGASWTTVQNLVPGGTIGTGTAFVTQNINLSAYISNASFQVRFRYVTNNQWWWAVDDISLTGTATPGNYSWTAVPAATAGLPAGAATPSPANANIVVTPTATGNTVYTATLTNAAGCTSSNTTTVTVNPTPVVTITANYCGPVPGKVRLTATSVPAATSYLWSTGATTSFIDVDIAGNYDVSVLAGGACPGTANIDVANELVVNGDFEAGNTGFTSDYAYKPDLPGLVPAGQGELFDDTGINGYSITPNGQNVHINFWGHDHSTPPGGGNFMAVNGHGNTLVVWKQTVNVLPNTTYYFSAWAMSLNDAGNNAQLQFSVNGTLVGTTAILANHNRDNNRASDNWTRFYGTWTSGPATTSAVIYINDQQPAPNGNDFGLDDVSFSTLSTFVNLESAPGTDAQTICVNTPLTNIVYSIGNGNPGGPTVSALPAGVTSVFSQDRLTISGTPTVAGNYTYSITTTGCSPYTVTGTITVQAQQITLSSGSASPTVCVNTPLNIGYTLGGTATGATATGLPAGVNISVAGTAVTISGTPTVAGSYPYTITTSGNCTPVTVSGTITVQAQTITLNSGNNTQTICINTPISNIQYTIGGTGTNASVSGLPPGVTGIYNSGFFIISGSPTSAAASPYTYTVTTSGASCAAVTATGTITVTPTASLTLTSGAGTNTQTVCKGSAITNITYSVNNGTGASVSGLPAGVTGSYAAGVFTITGTPSVGGTFTYTITTSGGCGFGTATGTITVQEQTLVLTSGSASPAVCLNAALPAIVYTFGGTATSATVTGLPAGVNFSVAGLTVTISGSPTASGSFPYVVTTSGTCGQVTANGTITVQPLATGGSLTPVSICSGGSGSLTLSGQVGAIVRWEKSTDGGTTWTPIANTTITQTYTSVVVPTLYRVVVGNGCGNVFSTVALVGIHNLWTGAISTDWNTAGNWSDNQVPSISCPDVYIPNTVNKPILSGAPTATIMNINIFAGATVTVSGTGLLQIAGTISNLGIFDVTNGAIEFNGASPQTIAANTFKNNAIHDLLITNSAGTGVTMAGPQDVYRSLTYGKNGAILNTGGFLTLKSTITETAWLGDMTNHTINGNVTVERYIATGPAGGANHGKSWQMLAVPTQGQTIKQSWQEGATATNVGSTPGSPGNPVPGYGTMITSNVANAATQPLPGFDALTAPGPTVKVYNYITTNYDGPANTGVPVYNQKGYFVFVRGDRSVFTSNGAAVPTILRTKGTLFTPANPAPSTTVFAGKFESVGNPYASAIDMRNITLGGGTQEFFEVWDPRLGGTGNLGAFQTFGKIGTDYYATPGGGSYGFGPANFIQSGQAFFVQAFGSNGTVSFTEAAKANGSVLFTTPNPVNQVQHTLRTSLNTVNSDGSTMSLVDGVLSVFDDAYSNDIDGMDARKMINTGENVAIKSAGKLLTIERRHTITQQDTIFLNITSEKVQPYRFHFDAENLDPSVQGFVVDNYTNTRTPLNMTGGTDVNFTVANVTGSNAANRFMIVFEPLKALPVTFTSVKAYKEDKNINVEWKVDNEMNMKQYEVEKSTNGTQFSSIAVKAASANNGGSAVYVIADANPVEGFNYYRIKSVDMNGKLGYTNVVKVMVGSMKQNITIYPNPITDGMIHLQLMNEPEGKYNIRLLNKLGQLIVQKQITHAGGNATEIIKWDYNLARGMYQLEVTKPDGTVKDLNVMY